MTTSYNNKLGYNTYAASNKHDPFTQNNKQCASVYSGSHWCSPQELMAMDKADLKKAGANNQGYWVMTASCGTWKPGCGMGSSYGCWYFEGSVIQYGKWAGPLKTTYQGGNVACCSKGKYFRL
jgi:hypothetical protein